MNDAGLALSIAAPCSVLLQIRYGLTETPTVTQGSNGGFVSVGVQGDVVPIGYTGVPPIPASEIPAYDATSATYVRVLCKVVPDTLLAWGVDRTPSPKPATRSSLSPCRTSAWRGVCASIGAHAARTTPFCCMTTTLPPPSILRQVLHPGPGVCVHHRQRHLDVLECRSGRLCVLSLPERSLP